MATTPEQGTSAEVRTTGFGTFYAADWSRLFTFLRHSAASCAEAKDAAAPEYGVHLSHSADPDAD